MVGERSRYGLLVSAVGAVTLAVSALLPWYELGAPAGAGLAGRHSGSAGAQQALGAPAIVLLVLAALAVLDCAIPLARRAVPVPAGGGAAVVLLGSLAAACVLYRMVDPPAPISHLLTAVSLREGAWLALLGSLAMLAGGLWPRGASMPEPFEPFAHNPWSRLSRWTPER